MQKVFNILVAGDYYTNETVRDYVETIRKKYAKAEQEKKFSIGEWRVVTTVKDIEDTLGREQFDILICFDLINGERVGTGSMKRWNQMQKKLRILLFMSKTVRDGDPKSGKPQPSRKPALLFDNGFYDCFFCGDIQPEELIEVTVNGRTKENALVYYHLAPTEEDEADEMEEDIESSALFISPQEGAADDEIIEEDSNMEEMEEIEEIEEREEMDEELREESDGMETSYDGEDIRLEQEMETSYFSHGNSPFSLKTAPTGNKQIRGTYVEAEIVFICSDDTAVIRVNQDGFSLREPQFENAQVLIPYAAERKG